MNKPIGKYLGNGRIELNDYGLKKLIAENIKKNEVISEEELIERINKKLAGDKLIDCKEVSKWIKL